MTTLIRLATPRDAADIAEIYRPAVADAAASFELEPPDAAEMAARVATVLTRTPWIVCETGQGSIAGYAYASRHRDRAAYQWSVEVSAYVRQAAHRSGVGRALYTSLFAILVVQGFRNAYAGITLPNPASVGFHKALGFTSVGIYRGIGYKAGAWHDVEWLERELAPRVLEPNAPVALPSLIGTTELDSAMKACPLRYR
ncbi:GNAT family N-acetyltransferase [soil metagenome]